MKVVDTNACFMVDDDLLNFSFDGEEDKNTKGPSSSSLESFIPDTHDPDDHNRSFPEFVEEELEWLSNKDAFPEVETCLDVLSDHPGIVVSHHSPVSVLENSTSSSSSNGGSTIMNYCSSFQVPTQYPVRARSKRKQRRRTAFPYFPKQQCWWWNQASIKNPRHESPMPPKQKISGSSIGRSCHHCLAESTPQWRAGPMGPKTLCNACGVRYKSGRLVPEYRPASSPTFTPVLHSNSHRKIVEMRKQKQLGVGGVMVNEGCGYSVA